MTRSIALWVAGTPRPQPRPRFVKGRTISTSSRSAQIWKRAIIQAARGLHVEPVTGPVKLELVFHMPTREAARWGKPHTYRPDGDNLAKLVMDALTASGIWSDDAAAAQSSTAKVWAQTGGVGIQITSL